MAKRKPEVKVSWKDVKSTLVSRETKELLGLIQDLYALSDENKRFIDTRCGLGGSLKPFEDQIESCMFPDVLANDDVDISGAKRVISQYRKATDDPIGTLDLMIFFVECGTRFTLNYGDMWEEFYGSLESMFGRAVKLLETMDKRTVRTFLPRLEQLVWDTADIGWGYHDGLKAILSEAFPDAEI
jgi:hypothetical protein